MAKTFVSARWLLVGLLGLALWLTPGLAYGQSQELIDAYNRTVTLYSQGRYQEALPLGEKAVRLGEQEFGTNHPIVANLLDNLARSYHALGRYAKAQPRLERALVIREEALGPEHPAVATTLNGLAGLYVAQGRYSEAEPL